MPIKHSQYWNVWETYSHKARSTQASLLRHVFIYEIWQNSVPTMLSFKKHFNLPILLPIACSEVVQRRVKHCVSFPPFPGVALGFYRHGGAQHAGCNSIKIHDNAQCAVTSSYPNNYRVLDPAKFEVKCTPRLAQTRKEMKNLDQSAALNWIASCAGHKRCSEACTNWLNFLPEAIVCRSQEEQSFIL